MRMPSPPSKAEGANWYNSMSQINVLACAALSSNVFRRKGKTDAIVSTSGHYLGAGLPDISRLGAGAEPFDHSYRTRTGRADAAR